MKILATLFVCVLVFTSEGNGFLLKKVYLKKSFLPQPVSNWEIVSPAFQSSLIPKSAVLNPNILVKNGNFLSFLSIHILTVISAITFKSFSKLRVNEIPVLKHVLTDQSFMTFSFGLLCSYFLPSSLRSLFINDTVEGHIWRYILPISLILRIISNNNPQTSEKLDNIVLHSENSIIKLVHIPLIIAFLFGTVGSYLAGLSTSAILTHFLRSLSHSFEQIQSAIIPVAALTASYIGGTVNFFETGHFLANIVGSNNPLKSREILDNLNIFAAMDINVMILYFTFLNFLYNKYSQNTEEKFNNSNSNSAKDVSESTVKPVLFGMGTVIAYFLCHQAVSAQRAFPSIPGLSVFLSTLLAFIWNLIQESAFNNATNLISTPSTASLKPWKAANSVLSDHFLSVFYFSLGLMMNWQLLFSKPLLDLSIIFITFFSVLSFHIVFIFGLSKMWNYLLERFLPKSIQEKWKIDHDSVLIASNACVGGSATAASMSSTFNRNDLIFSGSLAGIIGYMIGTPIGLAVFRFLRRF